MGTRDPNGVFDSGIGGLSVAREIHRALPGEELHYLADTAYCPYGDRPVEQVRERTLAAGRRLEQEGAKLLVVACNTASGAALEALRDVLRIPVVGLEPAVKTAAAYTRNRKVGVMATSGTLASNRYARLVREYAQGIEVLPQPCPGLADLIEEGLLEGPRLESRLEELTAPLRRAGVDTVVLGCTHYPFVQASLARVLGPGVQLVDSAPAIARRARALLEETGHLGNGHQGTVRVSTTGDPAQVGPVVARLWGAALPVDAVRL
jgi:glutamate racemase